jgi:GalNAc-alpha-(1->4)-GalNAc-alpha-(1->3)-diNAcBac-PP-undecaprenol alpha-1,4-N-acetyl-D-galactosaminyltransferase
MMKPPSNDPDRRTVVLVIGSLQGGGAERVMSDMANYWAEKGWRVVLVTLSSPDVPDFYSLAPVVMRVWLGVESQGRSPLAKLRTNFARVIKLRRLLRSWKPDAVLSFIDVPNVLTILAALGLKLRVVASERHNPDQTEALGRYAGAYTLAKPWWLLRRLTYRWADRITVLNSDAAQWIGRECRVTAEVIPNPLRELPSVSDEREFLVLGVGRLAWEKGFDLLLNAFAGIAHRFPDWRLVIFGEGPELARLNELRSSLRARDMIEIKEPVKDVELWMGRAGLIVLPSRFEGYGNAILESLGMGAAVISTYCAGPESFMRDGVNGRLVPVDDVDTLASAMAELMANPALRRSLGQEALGVRETHRQDVIMRKWEECLFQSAQPGSK